MPAAPWLALTLRYASQTARLEIANGFDDLTGSSQQALVGRRARPGNPSPSLHPHYRVSPLLRDGPPLCPASVLRPSRFLPLGDLPSAGRSNTRPAPSGRQVPTFRTGA